MTPHEIDRLKKKREFPLKTMSEDEIAAAIAKQQMEASALKTLKAAHHHQDGSEPVLTALDPSDIEQKIALQEHEWRLKSQLQPQDANQPEWSHTMGPESRRAAISKNVASQETAPALAPSKTMIAASCNCGQTLVASFGAKAGGEVTVRTYDVGGNRTNATQTTTQYGASAGNTRGTSHYAAGGPATQQEQRWYK